MVEGNHWDQWFSDGFGVRQPLVTMVFDGCAPLVRRWNGYVPSSKSKWEHCTAQISNEIIIVTGGDGTQSYVTEYHLSGDGNETPLSPMTKGRESHACGVYRGAGGEQVRRVCS